VTHYNTSGTVTSKENHYFFGYPYFDTPISIGADPGIARSDTGAETDPVHYTPWQEGKEFQTDFLDGNGNVLRSVAYTFVQHLCSSPFSTDTACWWTGGS
jgi:hypothetical protein